MESSRVETFWPPDPDGLRRWRRRIGVFFAGVYGSILLLLGAALTAFRLSTGSFDLLAHARFLAIPGALAVGIIAVMYFVVPWAVARSVTKTVERTLSLAAGLMQPGETLRAICPGVFLGPRTYREGYLLVSDRRLLRLSHTTAGYGWALLAERAALDEVVVVRRRSNRNPVLGALLGSMGTDRGLAITGPAGEQLFVTDEPVFDPLCSWFAAEGVPVGYRNDEDPAEVPRPAAVELTDVVLPGRGWRRRLLKAVRWAALLGLIAAIVYLIGWARTPTPAPPLPPFVASQPGLKTAQVQYMTATRLPALGMRAARFPLPAGPGRLVAEVRVVGAVRVSSAGVATRRLRVYQVVVFGKQGVLRTREGPVRWELLGKPGISDAALFDAAQRRLSVPGS